MTATATHLPTRPSGRCGGLQRRPGVPPAGSGPPGGPDPLLGETPLIPY